MNPPSDNLVRAAPGRGEEDPERSLRGAREEPARSLSAPNDGLLLVFSRGREGDRQDRAHGENHTYIYNTPLCLTTTQLKLSGCLSGIYSVSVGMAPR